MRIVRLAMLLLFGALLLPPDRAGAMPPPAQRLVGISNDSGAPQTDGVYVIWSEPDAAGATRSIYALPVHGGTRITVASGLPMSSPSYGTVVDPLIDNGTVVWIDEQNNQRAVRAMHLHSGELITVATGAVSLPGIAGDTVTWWEDVDPSQGVQPNPPPATLKARNLSTMAEPVVVTRTPNSAHGFGPSLTSDSWVVWTQPTGLSYAGRFFALYAVPLSGGQPEVIVNNTWQGGSETPVFSLFAGRVVYNQIHSSGRPEQSNPGSLVEIDLATKAQRDLGQQGWISALSINARYVFWASTRYTSEKIFYDLWGYDPLSNSAFVIAGGDEASTTRLPQQDMHGRTLVWTWQDAHGSAIYTAPVDALLPTAPRPAPSPARPDQSYFVETGHTLAAGFRSFWERSGGLPVFGYPLTDEFLERSADSEKGRPTQYLERQRFEYHPEHAGTTYEVLLGRLGVDMLRAHGRDWTQFPKAKPTQPHYFAETGQAIAPEFYGYWSSHGLEFNDQGVSFREALALFGYPISPPQMERNADGHTVLTQWFERARFEYHPNNPEPHRVLLGRLGAEVLQQRGW